MTSQRPAAEIVATVVEPVASPALRQHVSVKTAAGLFEVAERTIRRLIERGDIQVAYVGRAVRIPVEELERAFLRGPVTPAAPGVAVRQPRARRSEGRFSRQVREMTGAAS